MKIGSKHTALATSFIGCELELFENARHWKRYWSEKLRKYISGATLEVGAGIGSNSEYLLTDSVAHLTLLEPEVKMFAMLNSKSYSNRITCVKGRIGDLAQTFDTVVYIDVLEHIEDDYAETASAYDRLGVGGMLVVLAPAWPFLFSPFDKAVGHHRRYTKGSLRKAIDPRFETVSEFYLDSIGLFASLANRLFLRAAAPSHRQIEAWDRLMVPVSRVIDRLLFYSVGKTVVGVYRKR